MRRRFENVNMAMGNCFSPVMEGSQFQWNNIVVNSPVYITPIRRNFTLIPNMRNCIHTKTGF